MLCPMRLLKAFRFRAYTDEGQLAFVRQIAGATRLVFNLGRLQREMFGRKGRSFRYEGQRAELAALKEEAPFLKDVPHHCLQESLVDLQAAYDRFFKGLAGYPRPRRRGEDDSFRFPDPKQISHEVSADGKWLLLRLPKMGRRKGDAGPLRVRMHRPLQGELRSVTVRLDGDKVHVSMLCAVEVNEPTVPVGDPVGVDRGVAVPLMLSDGTELHVPLPTVRQRLRERRLHKALSRTKRGSANRRKAARALGQHKAKEARRRSDALHKATTRLAKNHRLIVLEKLKVRGMTASARGSVEEPGLNVAQKAGLNRALLSVGWGMAERMLAYKTRWYGSELVHVPPHGTSQTCSACGHRDPASRCSRGVFRCVACGFTGHADLNAANVILWRGLALRQPTPEDTGPGSACGALCDEHGVEPGNESREAGRPVL